MFSATFSVQTKGITSAWYFISVLASEYIEKNMSALTLNESCWHELILIWACVKKLFIVLQILAQFNLLLFLLKSKLILWYLCLVLYFRIGLSIHRKKHVSTYPEWVLLTWTNSYLSMRQKIVYRPANFCSIYSTPFLLKSKLILWYLCLVLYFCVGLSVHVEKYASALPEWDLLTWTNSYLSMRQKVVYRSANFSSI
jgi:hypothetical protein